MSNDGPLRAHTSGSKRHEGCVSHASHAVQLYRSDDYLVNDLRCWAAPALESGDAAIIIASQAHRAALADLLRGDGLDLVGASDDGRYVELDAAETLDRFLRNGWPDATLFNKIIAPMIDAAQGAARPPERRVWAFGEMVALLWAEQKYQAATRLEQLWNDLLRTRSFHLRCAYPVRSFAGQDDGMRFLKLCGEHTQVLPAEPDTRQNRPQGLRHRILSVSTNTRLLITRNDTLAVAGYSVASPKEPEEAAFLLATQPFDVVVIADSVREKKRAALISALRAIRRDVPIVFVHSGPVDVSEPLADMTVDVRSGPMALIAALQKNNPVRLVA